MPDREPTVQVPSLHVLRGSRLLRGVSESRLSELAKSASSRCFAEGTHLWQAGQSACCFTIIQRGLVSIERRARSGELSMLGLFGPTESIGEAAALELRSYPADALALTDVAVVQLPARLLVELAQRDVSLSLALQKALIEHTHQLVAKIDVMSAGSVAARLATLLLQLHERFGDEHESGCAELPLSLSRASLSRLVGARTETVIRALSSLQKRGIVRVGAGGFSLLRRAELEAIARDQSAAPHGFVRSAEEALSAAE